MRERSVSDWAWIFREELKDVDMTVVVQRVGSTGCCGPTLIDIHFNWTNSSWIGRSFSRCSTYRLLPLSFNYTALLRSDCFLFQKCLPSTQNPCAPFFSFPFSLPNSFLPIVCTTPGTRDWRSQGTHAGWYFTLSGFSSYLAMGLVVRTWTDLPVLLKIESSTFLPPPFFRVSRPQVMWTGLSVLFHSLLISICSHHLFISDSPSFGSFLPFRTISSI